MFDMTSSLLGYPAWLVVGFVALIIIMLAIDLGIFNKKSHEISNKEALGFSLLWISLAMLFSGLIWYLHGPDDFYKFQAAYWVEKALSVDNLFVFILVFGFFNIPRKYQHKVLFYGILGAIVFRAIFIFAGVELINHTYIPMSWLTLPFQHDALNPIMLLFGLFLVHSGIKSWNAHSHAEDDKDLSQSKMYQLINRFFKISPTLEDDKFVVVKNGVKMITPLFVALIIIELTDLVFAIDSIPAIFSIAPNDPFILYTSNIFAILGLRSLYFLLANSLNLFSKLHYGLAIILAFIGMKMIIMPWYHVPIHISLTFIATVLIVTVLWSFYANAQACKIPQK